MSLEAGIERDLFLQVCKDYAIDLLRMKKNSCNT